MIQIPFAAAMLLVSFLWILVRAAACINQKHISWKREAQLMLVYICIVVVMRFTFFPFSKVGGRIQPLLFDAAAVVPPRINLIPFVNLLNYEIYKEMLINVIGNTTMFIPLGIVWPCVFKKLDTHAKVIAAGVGFSLCIENLQLPFFDRVTDIDDLILNSVGFAVGYGIYLLVKAVKNYCRK
jgi:glycopeptide antibiotics resistance protein